MKTCHLSDYGKVHTALPDCYPLSQASPFLPYSIYADCNWYDYAKFTAMAGKALRYSPIHYIKGWKSPVLLIHGDDDHNPFSITVDVAKAYEATFQFMDQYLKKKR